MQAFAAIFDTTTRQVDSCPKAQTIFINAHIIRSDDILWHARNMDTREALLSGIGVMGGTRVGDEGSGAAKAGSIRVQLRLSKPYAGWMVVVSPESVQ